MPAKSPSEIRLSADERAQCDADIRAGSKSFYAASLLLPGETRLAARALYAFCRSSDDLVDEQNQDGQATVRLAERLDAIYAGRPFDLVSDRAFAEVVQSHGIPRVIPDALIEGFVWDERTRFYDTPDELLDYNARVASTVGVMMAAIMGCRDRHALARAADLGLAMQLTNIARDVGEDAARGRIYLPLDWLREEGIEPDAFLARPEASPGIRAVTKRLLDLSDEFYSCALSGVAALPIKCRPAIRSAAFIYRAIGNEIKKNSYDSISHRAHTSRRRKIELIARATAAPLALVPARSDSPHPSVAFLVDAMATREKPEIRTIDQKADRMIELLGKSKLHQTQRAT